MSILRRAVARAVTVEVDPEPQPDQSVLESAALSSIARVDAAMNMFRVNRMLPQQTLVDALLDVRHRLAVACKVVELGDLVHGPCAQGDPCGHCAPILAEAGWGS